MNEVWPWLALAGLGAFHGLNPGMGWLFAVALGLHRHDRRVVWLSVGPIALGHALAVALVAAAFVWLGVLIDARALGIACGILLIGWALYHWRYGHSHRARRRPHAVARADAALRRHTTHGGSCRSDGDGPARRRGAHAGDVERDC